MKNLSTLIPRAIEELKTRGVRLLIWNRCLVQYVVNM